MKNFFCYPAPFPSSPPAPHHRSLSRGISQKSQALKNKQTKNKQSNNQEEENDAGASPRLARAHFYHLAERDLEHQRSVL